MVINKESNMKFNGKVIPKDVYHPVIVFSVLFKTWGLRCGSCNKDFSRFSFIGAPKCPYCGTRNVPQFHELY